MLLAVKILANSLSSVFCPKVLQRLCCMFQHLILRPGGVPVSNLFTVGRQLNFLSYLGRNEKTILIFRRAPRVLLLKISCARRTVDYTHARVGRRSHGPERIELFDNF